MTIEAQAAFLTEVQHACRLARESKSKADLSKAAALLDSPKFAELPEGNREDLSEAYARAHLAVTCAGAA
jgi:hypothetical protein